MLLLSRYVSRSVSQPVIKSLTSQHSASPFRVYYCPNRRFDFSALALAVGAVSPSLPHTIDSDFSTVTTTTETPPLRISYALDTHSRTGR
jgi:hypothetical protein